MHESREELDALQTLLDESYASAGAHLKSIHVEPRRLTAEELCNELTGACILNLATVGASGAPIVAPVDGLFVRGQMWFCSSPDSVRFRHIRKNPQVSAAYTKGEAVSILIHGIAHEVDTSTGDYDYVHDYCLDVYGDSYAEWGYWGRYPFAWIEPRRMYAGRMPGA